MAGQLAFAPALAVLLLTPEFFLPLRTFALRYHAGAAGKAALSRIDALLAVPADERDSTQGRGDAEVRGENAKGIEPSAHLRAFAPLRQGDLPPIRFERVSYAYADGERPALAACTFTIPPGRRTVLVGASGAGKSTVVALLLRFIAPQQGQILVGDTPLAAVEPEAWRAQVAWVGQQPHLFQGSVLDNLRLARPAAPMDAVIAAAQTAGAHEFIAALPEGYATPIGEQGVRLSGGQRQRLAMARAFLKDAPLLLLDEATAHLDAASERRVSDALERLMHGRTVLMVAHRLEMARTADQIVVIEQGQAVEHGTHAALMAQNSRYRTLVASYEGGV
jgi:ATP-binding cassette subfamily C protein CydD